MIRRSQYSRFSQWFSRASGDQLSFILAVGLIIAWIVIGPVFHFSDTWQLVMNTISSIVTFLMVFVIQNTQNRQTDALQIKFDELIRATQGRTQRVARPGRDGRYATQDIQRPLHDVCSSSTE